MRKAGTAAWVGWPGCSPEARLASARGVPYPAPPNRQGGASAMAQPLGIICALPEEIEHLRARLSGTGGEVAGSFRFEQGRLDDVPVVLVEGFCGKVATALTATLLLDHFGCRGLIFSGVAGGLD